LLEQASFPGVSVARFETGETIPGLDPSDVDKDAAGRFTHWLAVGWSVKHRGFGKEQVWCRPFCEKNVYAITCVFP